VARIVEDLLSQRLVSLYTYSGDEGSTIIDVKCATAEVDGPGRGDHAITGAPVIDRLYPAHENSSGASGMSVLAG
jgi:hypothetical protein